MAAAASNLSVKQEPYGKHPSGADVTVWTLTNAAPGGITVRALDYGAILLSVLVPDARGQLDDVVLAYPDLAGWVGGKPWFNSLVGRNANRIHGAQFTLDGTTYALEANNLGNNLHSSAEGFNARCMRSREISGNDERLGPWVGVEMSFHSPDGDGGFPAALDVVTSFRLYGDNTLHMDFRAQHAQGESSKATLVNMCNHAYWNLNGTEGKRGILEQELLVAADAFTELDGKETMLTTGRILPVEGTPFDFRKSRPIGLKDALDALEKAGPAPSGYDHNFVLRKGQTTEGEGERVVQVDGADVHASFAARLHDPASGRTMDIYTSAPGIQVYSGNFLNGSDIVGRGGVAYEKHAAVCLETQVFPGAITHAEAWKDYPSPVLRPGDKYVHVVQHKFSTGKPAGGQ